MAENKLVIKINYEKDSSKKAPDASKMITVWHTRRIMIALTILASVIALLYVISNHDSNNRNVNPDNLPRTVAPATTPNTDYTTTHQNAVTPLTLNKTIPTGQKESSLNSEKRHTQEAIIFDRSVIRASLNTVIKDNEPYEPLIGILKLTENQRIPLFYFTQLKTGSGLIYHHLWWKDGKLIYKKTLTIKENKNKLVTSKSFSFKDKGEWQIQLADRTGKVLSEVKFSIDTE